MGRPLNTTEMEFIKAWEYPHELISYAIEKAELMNKHSIAYVNSILQQWQDNGVKTIQQAQQSVEYHTRHNRNNNRNNNAVIIIKSKRGFVLQ